MSDSINDTKIPMDAPELAPKKTRKPRVISKKDDSIETILSQPVTISENDIITDNDKQEYIKQKVEQKIAKAEKKEKKEKVVKEKVVKEKVVKEEPEQCPICCENYTSIIRKKCVCKYCNADTCAKCIERYLLDSIQDAHCLHCKVNYNDVTLREICTMTYLQQTYFKHRQEILVNREKANLPGLQDMALEERKHRQNIIKINEIESEIIDLEDIRKTKDDEYITKYTLMLSMKTEEEKNVLRPLMKVLQKEIDNIKIQINNRRTLINEIRNPITNGVAKKEDSEEKKKFIRRCLRDGCQGFLSTAWKCGICEHYSCNKCFKVRGEKHDSPHECIKEDVETADLIKKDSKPCPKCGEFITRSQGCSMMFCVSCQTPWDWNSGKIVTSGTIHNPHYYEWLQRTGGNTQTNRNPLDVPCGGYPNGWELRKLPQIKRELYDTFYEFHRICQEIQDISTRTYRSHLDNTATNTVHVKFLLNDIDEKQWGQILAKNEKKRKRDQEVQEIFAAFRMVAVELINRIQNYTYNVNNKPYYISTVTPINDVEQLLTPWVIEVNELINMINKALQDVSIGYHYVVPNIVKIPNDSKWTKNVFYYRLENKNYYEENKKKRVVKDTSNSVFNPSESLSIDNKIDTLEEPKAAGGAGISASIPPLPIVQAQEREKEKEKEQEKEQQKRERIQNLIIIAQAEGNTKYVSFLEDELRLLE